MVAFAVRRMVAILDAPSCRVELETSFHRLWRCATKATDKETITAASVLTAASNAIMCRFASTRRDMATIKTPIAAAAP